MIGVNDLRTMIAKVIQQLHAMKRIPAQRIKPAYASRAIAADFDVFTREDHTVSPRPGVIVQTARRVIADKAVQIAACAKDCGQVIALKIRSRAFADDAQRQATGELVEDFAPEGFQHGALV